MKANRTIEIYYWDTGETIKEAGEDIHFDFGFPLHLPGVPIQPLVRIGLKSTIDHMEKVAILIYQPCIPLKAGNLWRGFFIVSAKIGIKEKGEALMPVAMLDQTQSQTKQLSRRLKEHPGHDIYEFVSKREIGIGDVIKIPKKGRKQA